MEAKRAETESLQENSLLWMTCRAGIPRFLVESLIDFSKYCADRVPEKMGLGFLRVLAALLVIVVPRSITYTLLYPIFRLVFGNLYPAYASYKAVRTKNVKEYVKWMMYWIVFALFTCAETFTDVFFSFWFPFYYEIKTILVVWLLSPATKGSSILYRRFVHPALIRREAEIDDALARATEQGYTAVLHLGSKGVNYATTVLMQTAIKGGGGLVQHLKKSYSLSDLTGEKEDENRNTPHMHDETDMEVEPRRREHVGRRGYSPRRTQSSSSNRVEMYFSEVDIDVRQPRPREPTVSLTNIRSSDDISSGYSSGEALQSTRASQGDSLVRTSSVGARTRAKTRPATKKTPEDAGKDSDNNDLSPSIKISFPSPLSHVTPEQALEILLLLSQNSNVADYIRFDHGPPVAGNNDLENTSQSGPTPEANETEVKESDTASPDSAMMAEVQIIQSIESKPIIEHLETTEVKQTVPKEAETKETVDQSTTESSKDKEEPCTVLQEPMKVIDHTAITDELCQNKFDELKQLLSDAHKAVTNIVYTQEKLRSSDTNITESQNDEDAKKDDSEDSKATLKEGENENRDSLDDWTTSTVSRSNSDSRAGKYNKKPAPKAPLTESEEDLMETESQNALKATLVIKTGTLKTFSNTSTSKDVFIAHVSDLKSKSKKSKRQRTKEGFSKLLTIPKNIFHSAFNREQKGSPKMEDSESDVSAAPSRSNSLEPQETIVELVPKSRDAQSDDKSDNDTSNGSDQYVLAPNDGSGEKNAGTSKDSETIVKEMSQSPRASKKLESDIY